MAARVLEHVSIRTQKLDETVRFYSEILGLVDGPRPSTRPGAWMYDERGVPVIHVSYMDPNDPAQQAWVNAYLGHRDPASLLGGGAIDHVAFAADDYDGFVARCEAKGLEWRPRTTDAGLRQIFVTDPNGISVELNFHEAGA